MNPFYFIFLLALLNFQCSIKEENTTTQFSEKPEVPLSIKKDHVNLLNQIYKLTLFEDSAGLAARKLHKLMQYHFNDEEDFVLPQLGLLPLLANGKLPEQGKEVIQLSEKLKSHLSTFIAEHQLIKAYVDELKQAASKKNLPDIIEFEKELQEHSNIEEEVFFPCAILISEYLKLKLN